LQPQALLQPQVPQALLQPQVPQALQQPQVLLLRAGLQQRLREGGF